MREGSFRILGCWSSLATWERWLWRKLKDLTAETIGHRNLVWPGDVRKCSNMEFRPNVARGEAKFIRKGHITKVRMWRGQGEFWVQKAEASWNREFSGLCQKAEVTVPGLKGNGQSRKLSLHSRSNWLTSKGGGMWPTSRPKGQNQDHTRLPTAPESLVKWKGLILGGLVRLD